LNDNLELVETLGQVVKSAGYESLVTTSEQWALKILRTLPIDLFTQDIKRNGMGGWGFLRAMKSDPTLRHIPVLIISAATKSSQTDEAKRYGLDVERDLAGYYEGVSDERDLLEVVHESFS